MQMRRSWIPLVGLALAAGLASCPKAVAPNPHRPDTQHTARCGEPVPEPTPDMDALYAEAEWVVRRATELEEQAIREGSYPAELEELLADPYLSLSRAGVAQYWELGWKQAEGESAELSFRPRPGLRRDDSEVALEACLLATSTVDGEGSVMSESGIVHMTYFFKHVEGDLKLFTSTGEEVEKCPFE